MNENDWTNVDSSDVKNYSRSKTLAEKAAWDFMRDNKGPSLLTFHSSLRMLGKSQKLKGKK